MIFAIAVRIVADMRVHQPRFITLNFGKAFLELNFTVLGRLNLSSRENYSRLIPLGEVVVMASLAVVAQDLYGGVF